MLRTLLLLCLLVFVCAQQGGKGKVRGRGRGRLGLGIKRQIKRMRKDLGGVKQALSDGQAQIIKLIEEEASNCQCAEQMGKQLAEQIKAGQDNLAKQFSEQLKSSHDQLDGQIKSIVGEVAEQCKPKEPEKPVGNWDLAMNINPADGHIFGYTVGWATGTDVGSAETALTKDYLSATEWAKPANYIAIVRHQQGVVDAVKVFKFKVPGDSLKTRFGLKNMNPGRQIASEGGPIQESVAADAGNLDDDPIFGVGGDLALNWAYSNNGCRIALTGGHLSAASANDDNTHGLGNDFQCNPLSNTSTKQWPHDVSNIQDCPLNRCSDVMLQGTDHGPGSHLKSGPVYGNYALFVNTEADAFPGPGSKLG